MLAQATLRIDPAAIEHNARTLVTALAPLQVVGVTKVTCADAPVAHAMLAGGVTALADSRLENLARLRDAGIDAPLWLLRSPTPALAEKTVALADVSLQSDLGTLVAVDEAARAAGRRHMVVLMVDVGDLREGVMPEELPALVDQVRDLEFLDLLGIGTSLTCYGAVVPTECNLGTLVALAREAEAHTGRDVLVSGGMSSSIELALAGKMPAGIDNLRIGESIILGVSTLTREPLAGLRTDALTLEVPVIECLRKPSVPIGETAQDAFGVAPVFEDRGTRMRAICALGKQDAPPEGLIPLDPRIRVLGASSDHLVLDVDALPAPLQAGDSITFRPTYAAALRLFTSPYVLKVHVGG